MILEIVTGSLLGAAVGVGVALVPGLGTVHSAIASTVISVWNPLAGAACHVVSYVVGTICNSAKEAIDPELAGDPEMVAVSPDSAMVIDSVRQSNSLVFSKVIGAGLGLVTAYFLGGSVLSFTGIPSMTLWVTGGVLLLLLGSLRQYWLAILGVFAGAQLFFHLAAGLGIINPVFALGGALFVIPSCLSALGQKVNNKFEWEGTSKHIDLPDPVKGVLCAVLGIATPGVSPGLLIAGSTSKTNQLTQLTYACVEQVVTVFGLVGLIAGVSSGKSGLLVELSALPFGGGVELIVLYGLAVALGLLIMPWIYATYRNMSVIPGVKLLALAVSVATVILSAGPVVGLVLIALGIVINAVLKAVGCPRTVLSLCWASPVLF